MKALAKCLLAAALISACYDDPQSIVEPPSTAEDPSFADPFSTTQAQVADTPVRMVDPFHARLSLDLVAGGQLSPNSPVTLRLEGVANDRINSGSVVVTTPTVAAMTRAGADKPLRFPAGERLPTVAEWRLPAMNAGDSWTQTIMVASVEEGYYHVAVNISARGPENTRGSYIVDDTYQQAWMFVSSEGGLLTGVFDKDIFSDGIAPQPGPFKARGAAHTTSSASADLGADSDGSPIYLDVVYPDGDSNAEAVGAYAFANTVSNDGEDENWSPRNEGHTVPSSGIVAFSCPNADENWAGHVTLPSTNLVAGGHFAAYWQASSADCGDTIQVSGSRHQYKIWDNLKKSVAALNPHFGVSRPLVRWVYTENQEGAHYDGGSIDRITFGTVSYEKLWSAAHEYMHALHEKSLGGLWSTENCNPHSVWVRSSYTCAFSEGFADYGGYYVDPDDTRTGNLQDHDVVDPPNGDPAEVEGNVAMLLLDLIDSDSESGDETSYSPYYIVGVFKSCEVKLKKFGIPYWDDRDDVSDYVWCLENQVVKSVHDQEFPAGPNAPDDAKETASEPSDWDAADIRTTWANTVG